MLIPCAFAALRSCLNLLTRLDSSCTFAGKDEDDDVRFARFGTGASLASLRWLALPGVLGAGRWLRGLSVTEDMGDVTKRGGVAGIPRVFQYFYRE